MDLTVMFLAFAVMGLFFLLAIPFAILGLALGVVVYVLGQVLVLPFRLAGLAVGVGAGALLFFVKLFMVLLLGLFLVSALVIGLTPVLPLVMVFAGLWLLLRSGRSRRDPQGRPVA